MIRAYRVQRITTPMKIPDMKQVAKVFPTVDLGGLTRSATDVDILVGLDIPNIFARPNSRQVDTGSQNRRNRFWLFFAGTAG